MKNSLYLITVCVIMLFTCVTYAEAQGVRLYKTDGSVVKISDTELDSIVSLPKQETHRVYKSNGYIFNVLYSELDSIVGVPGVESNNNFVDLGLSVMWASRNVGAVKVEDYGDYFAWGEISPKTSYTKDNNITNGLTVDAISGNDKYDAARALWGDLARIPTFEELQELRDKCTWEWTSLNGVNGQMVTGPNGNSIFLPAAGIRRDSLLENAGEKGAYWSATSYEGDYTHAYNNIFNSSGYWGSMRSRSDGLSVRPVSGKVQCLSYTGDTIKVDEFTADVSVLFTYVPAEGIIGGIEYTSYTTGVKQEQTIEVKKDGEYVITLTGLERGTKYNYRSFVKINNKNVYGKTEEFITKNKEDNLSKGTWIDLGLSVKWASHNIGAQKPEDNGDYYAWGEIYPKQMYEKNNSETTGVKITDISGNTEYDAASVNWGGGARIPTQEEMNELCEKCTWQWVPRNGVNGMLVTGPNGNSIFLPAAGLRLGAVLDYGEINGFYWNSTPDDVDDSRANGLTFNKGGFRLNRSERFNGRSLRPVSD